MFDDTSNDEILDASGALAALEQLEQSSHERYVQMRSSDRVDFHAKLLIRPGNSGDRHLTVIEGVTTDISDGGCRALLVHPILPGNVFFVEFDQARISVDPLLVRCLRCKFVREDSFDVSFSFFSSIDLLSEITVSASPDP